MKRETPRLIRIPLGSSLICIRGSDATSSPLSSLALSQAFAYSHARAGLRAGFMCGRCAGVGDCLSFRPRLVDVNPKKLESSLQRISYVFIQYVYVRFSARCPRGPGCPGLDTHYLPTLYFIALWKKKKKKRDLPSGTAWLHPAENVVQ